MELLSSRLAELKGSKWEAEKRTSLTVGRVLRRTVFLFQRERWLEDGGRSKDGKAQAANHRGRRRHYCAGIERVTTGLWCDPDERVV